MNTTIYNIYRAIFAGILVFVCLLGVAIPSLTNADYTSTTNASYVVKKSNNTLLKVAKTIKATLTAYSSTEDQTDDTPFITASGKTVADGIIANNLLPFGTKVRIPSLYGNKIFVVQDRMNRRWENTRFDVWMPDLHSALHFGVKQSVDIEVLAS